MGHAVYKPGGGDARHPGADEGNALANEKKTVVAMPQRS